MVEYKHPASGRIGSAPAATPLVAIWGGKQTLGLAGLLGEPPSTPGLIVGGYGVRLKCLEASCDLWRRAHRPCAVHYNLKSCISFNRVLDPVEKIRSVSIHQILENSGPKKP